MFGNHMITLDPIILSNMDPQAYEYIMLSPSTHRLLKINKHNIETSRQIFTILDCLSYFLLSFFLSLKPLTILLTQLLNICLISFLHSFSIPLEQSIAAVIDFGFKRVFKRF